MRRKGHLLTESDILEALQVCYDPELRINIVDLGRVHRIAIAPDSDAPGIEPRDHSDIRLLTSGND